MSDQARGTLDARRLLTTGQLTTFSLKENVPTDLGEDGDNKPTTTGAPISTRLSLLPLLFILLASGCAQLNPIRPLEQSMIYQPAPYPDGNWTPGDENLQDAHFKSKDGTKLHGWYLPHPNPRAIVLFSHGNAGNLTSRIHTLRSLNKRHGVSVMTYDYRGYGRSAGEPSENGILEDARAARSWLAEASRTPEKEIVLVGRSLGGAVSIDLASKDGARGLVVSSTFTSLPDVGAHHLPWLPTWLVMSQRLNSLAKIRNYPGPVLLSHGDSDQVIPYEHGQKLYEACPGPKQFITLAGGGHNDPPSEQYEVALDQFFRNLRR